MSDDQVCLCLTVFNLTNVKKNEQGTKTICPMSRDHRSHTIMTPKCLVKTIFRGPSCPKVESCQMSPS